MPDDGFQVDVVGGMPVVAAPEQIDITNAEALRSALLQAAASGPGPLVVDMTGPSSAIRPGRTPWSPRISAPKLRAMRCC